MKKFLLTAVLILAIVVSLTAGTMASYKTNTTLDSSEMLAKTFEWNVHASNSFAANANIKLAPGDAQKFSVKIENKGETPMAINSAPDLSGDLAGRLTLTLDNAINWKGETVTFVEGYELVSYDTLTLTYIVNWPYDVFTDDNDYMGKGAKLGLKLSATQINREFTHSDGGIQ